MARRRAAEEVGEREEDFARVRAFLEGYTTEIRGKELTRQNRVVTLAVGREHLFLKDLEEVLSRVFAGKLGPLKYVGKASRGHTQRILNLLLSDVHYGSDLDKREVGHSYGPVEEARRTAHVCKQATDYKRQYRADTELYVHVAGDMIQGQLHDPRDGRPLAEQFGAALHILVQAIKFLAQHFPKGVTVFTTPGNHGRNTMRHKERATNQKWDSIETMLYSAMRAALSECKNVKFVIEYAPYYSFQAFDQRGFVTHGDTVIKPGYPGQSISVGSVSNQINSLNAAEARKGNQEYSLVAVGHVHVGSMTHLANGAVFISNGPLIPSDAYAKSIGLFETACGQWLWESVPGHIVGDSRFITVNSAVDADESLDAIIAPFKSL